MCFGAGKKAPKRRSSACESPLESRGLRAGTYPDTSPVTSSSPNDLPLGRGQMVLVVHQPSLGAGLHWSPFEEFCSGKRTDSCPRLPLGLRPGKHLSFFQGLNPRPRAQLPPSGAGFEDRMGPATAETREAHTVPSILASRSRRGGGCASPRSACRLPSPLIADATGGPIPSGSSHDPDLAPWFFQRSPSRRLPSTSVPCSRFLPAGVWGSLVHLSRWGPAGKPGAALGAQTVVKGASTHQRGWR